MNNHDKLIKIRTDLAFDEIKRIDEEKIQGVIERKLYVNDIFIIEHHISKKAESIINKSAGTYYTIDLKNTDFHDHINATKVENALSYVIKSLIQAHHLEGKRCLIVGLGNDAVTPDCIGPYTVDNIVVTSHLEKTNDLNEGYSIVSAISPGVLGTTGLETYDIILSLTKKIKFDYCIVIDALASSSVDRLNKTIQITDTGILPGSGVGNKRKELSSKTMGIPVIAVGVPTVVDAVSIVNDAMNKMINYLEEKTIEDQNANKNIDIKKYWLGKIGSLNNIDKRYMIDDILTSSNMNMFVTSKDIDEEVEDISKIVAWGINKALHPSLADK